MEAPRERVKGTLYVKHRRIHQLFQELISTLLAHRPDDHISFLLHQLNEIKQNGVPPTRPLLPPLVRSEIKRHRKSRKKSKSPSLRKVPYSQEEYQEDLPISASTLEVTSNSHSETKSTNQSLRLSHIDLQIPGPPLGPKPKYRRPIFCSGIILKKDTKEQVLLPDQVVSQSKPNAVDTRNLCEKNDKHKRNKTREIGQNRQGIYLTDRGDDSEIKINFAKKNKKKGKELRRAENALRDMDSWPTPQESFNLTERPHEKIQQQQTKLPRKKLKWRDISNDFKYWLAKPGKGVNRRYLQKFIEPNDRKPALRKVTFKYRYLADGLVIKHKGKTKSKKNRKAVETEKEGHIDFMGLLARKRRLLEDAHYDFIPHFIQVIKNASTTTRRHRDVKKAKRRKEAQMKTARKEKFMIKSSTQYRMG